MQILTIILILIVILNGIFCICFISDLLFHRKEVSQEPGSLFLLAISSTVIFFLSSFGISDFAISTILYRMKNLVSDKILPGTLNTQCVAPVAVMALAFISVIKVEVLTLVVCILAQISGSYIGPRITVRFSSARIRKCISIGLLLSALFIVAGKFNLLPLGGTATGLSGIKLFIAAISLFVFGALNTVGIGSYPLTMATIYALGLNPASTFPIMMGACAFSIP